MKAILWDIFNSIRHDIILVISFIAAAISCFFVCPDEEYAGYIDWRTLALLYCLMVVVAGLRQAGVFSTLAQDLCGKAKSTRHLGFILVMLCFVSSMLITNDVALLTFVPFSIMVLSLAGRTDQLVMVVVLQTVAANMGSMLTPVGNPQNLYIYSYYNLPALDFLRMTFPVWIASLIAVLSLCLMLPKTAVNHDIRGRMGVNKRDVVIYSLLFVVCLLVVLRVITWPVMLIVMILVLAVYDWKMLLRADFLLLLTFICFFIFSGNLARIDAVFETLSGVLRGHEMIVSAVVSQFISNVPATLLLSSFTGNAEGLLLGVDIGGLGTPVASLASLISIKLYLKAKDASLGKFMLRFSIINFGLLAILLGIFTFV